MTPTPTGLENPVISALISSLTSVAQVGIVIFLQTAVFLLLGLTFAACIRNQRPALLSAVYRSLLVGTILTSVFSVALIGQIHPLWSIPTLGQNDSLVHATKTIDIRSGNRLSAPAENGPVPALQSHSLKNTGLTINSDTASQRLDFSGIYLLIAGIWSIGVVIQFAWLLLASLHTARLRKESNCITDGDVTALLNRLSLQLDVSPPLLLANDRVQAPFLCGLFRPAILLPTNYATAFSESAMQAIFLHELAHHARRDCWWKHIAGLAGAVLWTQPLLWLLRHRLEQINESLCDETVVSSGCPARTYANFLLDLANHFPLKAIEQATSVGIVPFRSALGRRIQQIMKISSSNPRPLSTLTRSAIIIGMTGALVSALMLVSIAAPQEPTDGHKDAPSVKPLVSRTAETSGTASHTAPDNTIPDLEGHHIAEVHIEGNHNVPQATILPQVTTQRGTVLSSRQLDMDRAKIDALGFFALVEHQVTQNIDDPAKVDVTFRVKENRIITGFQFVRAIQIKPEELQKILKSQKGSVLSRPIVAQDVEAIQRLYREKGFAGIVTGTIQLDSGTLVFTIQEGKISRIELSGLEKIPADLVRKQIHTKPGDAFTQTAIREDLNRIYDMGFFADTSFKVNEEINKPGSLVVTIVVQEKPAN